MADTFTVRTADSTRYIESKFLKDANGNFVTSPNAAQKTWNLFDTDGNFIGTNTNGYVIVPANFDIKTAIDFGRSLAAMGLSANTAMIDAFKPGGWLDIQTNYNGMTGDNVPAYRVGASYLLGIVGAEAGYSLDRVKLGGGSRSTRTGCLPRSATSPTTTAAIPPIWRRSGLPSIRWPGIPFPTSSASRRTAAG